MELEETKAMLDIEVNEYWKERGELLLLSKYSPILFGQDLLLLLSAVHNLISLDTLLNVPEASISPPTIPVDPTQMLLGSFDDSKIN